MTDIMKLLQPINATVLEKGGAGGDISPWIDVGVPGATLKNQNDRYFYFHHSNGKAKLMFGYMLFVSSFSEY